MISGLFGLPGSGKSLLLSYLSYRASIGKSLNYHGFHIQNFDYQYVFTNFPCDGCYSLDFDTLGNVYYHDCLMVCDEIQLFADSRNYRNFDTIKLILYMLLSPMKMLISVFAL